MGREIRRVPADFDWPVGEVWKGFVGPDYRDCPAGCKAGWSDAYWQIHEHVAPMLWMRDPLPEVRQVTGWLAGREWSAPFGHDSLDASAAVKKIGDFAGLPDRWYVCPTCGGSGYHPDDKDIVNSWERTDPPSGDAWQVWETVSEGSPVSPVFATPEEVVRWLVGEGYSEPVAWLEVVRTGYRGRLGHTGDFGYLFGSPPPSRPGARIIPGRCIDPSSNGKQANHPCPRKLAHVQWLVRWWSAPDDVVLDPFMGSGTTLVPLCRFHHEMLDLTYAGDVERFDIQLGSDLWAEAERLAEEVEP